MLALVCLDTCNAWVYDVSRASFKATVCLSIHALNAEHVVQRFSLQHVRHESRSIPYWDHAQYTV